MKLDELLPSYDVAAQYDILVQASPADTVAAIERTNFSEARLTKLLLRFRALGRRQPGVETGTQAERLLRVGFAKLVSDVKRSFPSPGISIVARHKLAVVPEKEIVFGLVGRFWRPDGGVITGLSAEEIIAFHAKGYAKAVWNFAVVAESEDMTRVTTETRIQAFGWSARWKFRAYWVLVSPFSGIIRKEILELVKRNAELHSG